jgi:hypothetical protein
MDKAQDERLPHLVVIGVNLSLCFPQRPPPASFELGRNSPLLLCFSAVKSPCRVTGHRGDAGWPDRLGINRFRGLAGDVLSVGGEAAAGWIWRR